MKLIPLGVNGYLPINGRHSSCYLVLFPDAAFMLDAGTGAARLHEPEVRQLLAPYQELHVILSHYHVDHTAGLYYAFTAWRKGPLHVYAPASPFIDADPAEAIRRYFCPPLNSYLLEDSTIQVHPVSKNEMAIASHRIRMWPQQHPGGSMGLRIDDDLAYITDTVVMMEHAGKAAGVRLLLHELWLNEADARRQDKESQRHACLEPVAAFVAAAKPNAFMPAHLYPHYSDSEIEDMLSVIRAKTGTVCSIPREKQIYPIDECGPPGSVPGK